MADRVAAIDAKCMTRGGANAGALDPVLAHAIDIADVRAAAAKASVTRAGNELATVQLRSGASVTINGDGPDGGVERHLLGLTNYISARCHVRDPIRYSRASRRPCRSCALRIAAARIWTTLKTTGHGRWWSTSAGSSR